MSLKEIVTQVCASLDPRSILALGSYAQKLQDEKSDIDLLILTKAIPSQEERKKCYSKIPSVKILGLDNESFQNIGEWDISWTPVNDKLQIDKQIYEIGYNTISWVNTVIEKLINKNEITFKEFAFRPYTFLGLLESSIILYDKDDFVKKCRSKIRPMPIDLKKEIVKSFFPILKQSYEELKDYTERNIGILAFLFHLDRGLDAMLQILYVINEVYDPAFKRIEPFLLKLEKKPENLFSFLKEVLPRFFEKREEVVSFFEGYLKFCEKNFKS